jgi:hypothetical protein
MVSPTLNSAQILYVPGLEKCTLNVVVPSLDANDSTPLNH